MHDIALYYPHIEFRDDAWLKAAALYWPRIARLAPAIYPTDDSETARMLSGELDFILNIEPTPYAASVAREFKRFIQANREALRSRYSIPQGNAFGILRADLESAGPNLSWDYLPLPRSEHWHPGPDPEFIFRDSEKPIHSRIRLEKLTSGLALELCGYNLGARTEDGWVVVAPALAAVYLSALTERVASSNDLTVVTDQEWTHGILNGWDMETLANALLGNEQAAERRLDADDIGALYTAVAIRTVVPARIEDIPVDRIIKARRKLAAEFDAFRGHLSLIADRLTELGRIKDPSILQARLELMVERDLRGPTQDLEEKLWQLGLEPAQAVLGLKSLELPAAAAAAAASVALPPGVGQAGLVAARFVSSGVQSRAQRRQMLRDSPAGYLLGLEKQLTPSGVIERLRRTIRRAGRNTQPPAS